MSAPRTTHEAERLAMTALERVGLADEQAHAIAGGSPPSNCG